MGIYRMTVCKNEVISETTSRAYNSGITEKYLVSTISRGSGDFVIGKRDLKLFPEKFIVLNEGSAYSNKIESAEEVNICSILFDADFVCDYEYSSANENRVLLDNPQYYKNGKPVFIEAIYALNEEVRTGIQQLKKATEMGLKDEVLLMEYFNGCLSAYYDLYHAEVTNRAKSLKSLNLSTRSEILRRLSIARDYMLSNYNKSICLYDVALAACLSVNHLLRTFKQAYHQSPHQFLTDVRLQQAKYYLKNTDYSVSEIVDIVGFECPSSFTRLFRSSFKITPGKFR
ncbi:AraC family transcriptional regulator [Pedobacter frigoris]|uniref:helix-turn-helix transcriptional regulator n=1 Tax=Pedobacter frigoris TaxID=2571272 RepID=UPI00292F19A7|nr:AraC family transcriptional regulator [Pedobacter frigoris]